MKTLFMAMRIGLLAAMLSPVYANEPVSVETSATCTTVEEVAVFVNSFGERPFLSGVTTKSPFENWSYYIVLNPQTKTFTTVVESPDSTMACITDFGEINQAHYNGS